MVKHLVFTRHAMDALDERPIEKRWIKACIFEPEWVEIDPIGDGRERRFEPIAEFDNRVLRVICLETDGKSAS